MKNESRISTSSESPQEQRHCSDSQGYLCTYSVIKQRGCNISEDSRRSSKKEQKWNGDTDRNLFVVYKSLFLLGRSERNIGTKNHPGVIKNTNQNLPRPISSNLRQHNEKKDTIDMSANGINMKSIKFAILPK